MRSTFGDRSTPAWCLAVWLVVVALAQAVSAAPPSASWPLAWGDEFGGTSLDPAKWKWGSLPWGGQHHNDQYSSWITSQDSYLSGGSLWLRCRRAVGAEFGGYPYSEGFVHSDGRKNYTYGYAEIRARFATGTGTWPAFWTLSQGWPPEFDIAEYFGSDDRMHMGLAFGSSWQDVQWDSSNLYRERFGDWHTYGLEWGPGYAIWYMDGVRRKSIYSSNVPSSPMYLILNSGMRTDANYSAPYQNLTEIDYCRLFTSATAVVNDNTTGTSANQIEYVGSWGYYGSQSGAFFNDNHWSGNANDYYRLRFNGARVDLYAALAPNHGLGAVSIDGGPETLVDFYAGTRADKALVWSSPTLAVGFHTLRMRVTGTRNANSTGNAIPVDRVDIWPSAGRLAGAVIGTSGSWSNLGNTITNAFDANLHSFFDAPASEGWVGLDFGTGPGKRIQTVRFCPRDNYSGRMSGGQIQGANKADFSDALNLHTISTNPPEGRLSDATITHSGGFRYVRYLAPAGGFGNVAELEFHGITASVPAAPSAVTAISMDRRVGLTWSQAAGAASYVVRRSTASGGPYMLMAGDLNGTSYLDTAVTNGITYYYVVAAASSAGISANSLQVTATPLPPSLIHYALPGATQVRLSWPDWAGAYQLNQSTNLVTGGWWPVTNQALLTDGSYHVTISSTQASQTFFRLSSP